MITAYRLLLLLTFGVAVVAMVIATFHDDWGQATFWLLASYGAAYSVQKS